MTPGSGPQYGEVTQTVKEYKSQLLTFWFKDDYAANASLLGYYSGSVLIDGTPVWTLDPLSTGTSWTQYTVDVGRALAWAPSYTLALQGSLSGTVWNFGMAMSWDDVELAGALINNGDFEAGGTDWTYAGSSDGYWSGAASISSPHSGNYQYTLTFPDNQYSSAPSFGAISQNFE